MTATVRNFANETLPSPLVPNKQDQRAFEILANTESSATIYRLLPPLSTPIWPPVSETPPMADITREEIDAKLATVEARGETHFVELNGKIDRIADAISHLSGEISGVRADNKFTRLTIVVAVVGSVIAGLAALWVTQSNMLASFTAGLAAHDAKIEAQSPRAPKTP